MTADSGFVTFTATKGSLIHSCIFKVSKQKQGITGAPGTAYWISSELAAIPTYEDGTFKIASFKVNAMKQVTGSNPEIFNDAVLYAYVDDATSATTYASGTLTLNLNTVKPHKNIKIKMLVSGGEVDVETIPVICDGQTGDPGEKGDANYVLDLTNNFATVATDAEGKGGSYGGDNLKTEAVVHYGKTDDSSN